MSELVTPTSDPAYVTKLALRSIPFNDQIDSSLFYAGGQAGHRLNLLFTLLERAIKLSTWLRTKGLASQHY